MPTILIADDDAVSREVLVQLLVRRGHHTLEVANGREALEIARKEGPDLVLTDVLMPVMDGFELLRQLRLEPATASIPVILISGAYDDAAARVLAAAGGAVALVRKPFTPEEVFEPIDAALALGRRPPETVATLAEFGREHMRLLMDKLSAKAAEAELAGKQRRKSESLLAEAQRLAHIGSWEWDITTDTVTWSDEKYRIMGFEPQAVPVTHAYFLNCLHPDDRARVDKATQQAYRDHQPFSYDYRAILPDGRVRLHHVEATVVTDERDRVARMIGTTQDITERKQAEEALAAQALRYKTLMETSTDSIYVLDEKGDLQEANAAFLRRRGYTAAEVKGLNVADWEARYSREQLEERLRELVGSSAIFETRHRCKDSSTFDVEVCATSVRIGEKSLFFVVTRDITERKAAADALRESETRFRQLAENISQVFWLANPEGTLIHYVSPAYEKVWGRTCDSLYAEPASWMASIHPDDRERIAEAERLQLIRGEHDHTYRIVRADGTVRWIRDRAFPVRDESGKLIRVAGIAEDITERKEAERQIEHFADLFQTLSHHLLNIQEEERRHLARELHDEIGQILTAAKLNLKIIAPDVLPAAASRLEDSIQLLDRLLQQVRQLSLDLRPPLLDELGLVPALRWLANQQAQRTGLRITFAANVERVEMDLPVRTACFRVAQEAITNALRHARAATVAVELRAEPDRLWLMVHDDGVGFDRAAMQQRAARGASVGLLSMNERASLLGGELEVNSAPGRGTEIRAWFPLAPPGPVVNFPDA